MKPIIESLSSDMASQCGMTTSAAPTKTPRCSRTVLLRTIFVTSLVATLVVCTTVSYFIVRDLELEIARQTYDSVTVSALSAAKQVVERNINAGEIMESIMSTGFPDASMWPMVGLNGYYETAGAVATASGGTSIALIVMVKPEESLAFEKHAKQHYQSQGYPEEAGDRGIGFGIFRRDKDAPGGYSLDREGNHTTYGSTNQILTPVLDHSTWNSPMLMYNVHVSSTAVDSIIECSKLKKAAQDLKKPNCSVITGFKITKDADLVALNYRPIYPQHDPTTLVGVVGLSINFKDVLVRVVPDYFDGVTAVISAHITSEDHTNIKYDTVTYDIIDGLPSLVGEGDLHDTSYDDHARSVVLNDFSTDNTAAVVYQLTFYPRNFQQMERTTNPLTISLGFLSVILLSTIIFAMYDYLMRRQSNEARLVLDMKRRFVRFISHEIRTPLNTVSMGLELLESDIRMHQPPPSGAREESDSTSASHTSCATVPVSDKDLLGWFDITHDIQDNAASAVGILDDLLSYDKIEDGTLKFEVDRVDIVDVVTKTLRKFMVQAVKRRINLRLKRRSNSNDSECTSASSDDPETEYIRELKESLQDVMVVGDSMRLGQVMNNVISNALKFTPSGGSVEVSIKRRPVEDDSAKHISRCRLPKRGADAAVVPSPVSHIVISVKDTGVGLSKDQIARLFEEGIQFEANRLQDGGGSGLGLTISKSIVERHNGTIKATSEGPGCGSKFIVQLPLYERDESEYEEVEFDSQSQTSPPSLEQDAPMSDITKIQPSDNTVQEKHHVLVVEDVESSRKMLMKLLARAGHTCRGACNGQEAVNMIRDNLKQTADVESGLCEEARFDTILMDYEMPILNGPDATQAIRILGYRQLVFGVTGNVLQEDVDHFRGKGADDVLPKPVSMKILNNAWVNHK